MKAVVYEKYGPPDVLEYQEVNKPAPKHNEVLIKVYATTVTVADFRSRSFTVPQAFWLPARTTLGFTKPKKPILGVELAGEIESVGKDVKRFKKGDQVFAATLISYGAYAEYKCLPEDAAISIKPSNLTYEEAAALLEEIKALSPDSPEFQDKVAELKKAVLHHVQEEESEVFETARDCLEPQQLTQLGQEFQQAKTKLEDEVIEAASL